MSEKYPVHARLTELSKRGEEFLVFGSMVCQGGKSLVDEFAQLEAENQKLVELLKETYKFFPNYNTPAHWGFEKKYRAVMDKYRTKEEKTKDRMRLKLKGAI